MHWEVFAKDLSCVVLFLTLKTNRHEFLIFGINYAEVDMIKRFSILNFVILTIVFESTQLLITSSITNLTYLSVFIKSLI